MISPSYFSGLSLFPATAEKLYPAENGKEAWIHSLGKKLKLGKKSFSVFATGNSWRIHFITPRYY